MRSGSWQIFVDRSNMLRLRALRRFERDAVEQQRRERVRAIWAAVSGIVAGCVLTLIYVV